MSYKYSWTVTSKYHYDQTLTTDLIKDYLADWLDSSGRDTHFYRLSNMGNLSVWPSDREKQHDTSYHHEIESDEPATDPPTNSTYEFYENFKLATGLNFAELRSSAAAAGLASHAYIPNGLGLADNTSAGNITFDKNGGLTFEGSNTLAQDITFIDGGEVLFTDAGSGTQTLTGLLASKDLEYIDMGFVERGGSSILSGGQVRRNLRELNVGVSTYNPVSSQTGSGLLVDGLVVRGVLNSVYVASGASVNHLTVGLDRQWSGSDVSAFVTINSSGVPVPTYWGSRTTMIIASGGTATNITLGNGGTVYVSGLSDTVSSTYNSTTSQWEYTTHYASGTGGILNDLNMASSGGLQFEGITDPRATWNYPSNGYLNSSSYMSGFLATAPQSSYVSFGSNTSGSNINIGNGGSLYIDKDAHVSAISMGGLTTSTFFKNSSGTTDTWIGDRGASLQIRGGKVSGVVMDPVIQTFEYYSAAHDYFWLYSSSVSSSMQSAYYASHGEYPSGSAWESAVYASASAGYRQYMSAMYNSGAVYTNLGDDTAYNRRYVGGDIGVAGGWIMNVSGFSYLGVAADVDVTVSNNVSTWKTYQYTDGNVSKAIGAVSATLDVTGGAHVYNVKIEGGRVIMTGGGEVNARWHSRENKQSNYNLVEDLDLRIGDVLGLGSAYPAVIEFVGEGSGGYKQYISSGGTSGYVDYTWDAIDPGEIHSVTASKGLVVTANWTTHQDFTYTGSGAVTFNGLGTVVLKDNHSRYSSDSYYGTGPYLGSAFDEYYFGVVKGVYNEEDGVLENYTVLDGDVSSGGFDWEGFLMVGSGGIVQNIGSASPLKTGNDIVNSDTWTPEYTRDKCKVLTVVAGGLADNVTVKGAVSNFEHFESQYTESRAGLLVSSGGTATNVTVLEGGIAMAKGGTIDKVFVAAGGVLYLSGWAGAHQVGERDSDGHVDLSGPQYMDTTVLNGVRLDSGGQLTNTLDWGFRKGNAPSVIANKGGGIMNGVTANGVAYVSGLDYAGGITLTKDQQAIDVTVRGFTTVTSRDAEGNPTAWTTTIAYMNVSSGGIVNGATVGEDGAIYVSDGAAVSGLTASGGRLIFGNSSGWSDYFPGSAAVAGITLLDGGILEVNSKFALKATDMQIRESAGLELAIVKDADEDYAVTELNGTWTAGWGSGAFTTTDGVLSGFGGQFGFEYTDPIYGSKYTSARLSMTFLNSATLLDADMRGFGYFSVRDGAKVLNTKLKGITANIGGGGYASGLFAMTDPTNSAYQTNIYVYGNSQKGTVGFAEQTVMSGGYMMVEDGGFANGVTMLAPEGYEGPAGDSKKVGPVELEIVAGGTVSNVFASAGVVTIAEGSKDPGTGPSTLSNAEIHSSAMLLVNADGVVLDGALKLAGTVVTTAERYKYVEVQVTDPDTGDTYTDWQRVTLNNAVADAKTLTVSFDLTEHAEGFETAMIDSFANLDGAKYEFIYVNEDQAVGSYVLAGDAQDYKIGALKVVRGGKFAGTLTVSDGWGVLQVEDDLIYSVNHNANNDLVFSVESTEAAITNIVATSDGRELLKGKWSKYSVNIKTEVNKYSTSIWYRIKQAVKTRGVVLIEEDEWIELDNEKGLDVAEYCTVELKAKNEAGKDSEIVSYTVNYDATAPEFSDLHLVSGDQFLTDGVESQVSVLVWDELDPAPTAEFSLDGEEWTELQLDGDSRATFTVTGGIESFQLRSTDHAENVNTLVISIPLAPVASADIITVTNQDVTVSADFSADSMVKQYSLDGGETWKDYDEGGVVLEDNATVSFRAGNILGYSEVATLTVDNIDKEPPKAPEAAADITELTNRDVTVTATFSEDSVKKEYTLDGGETWQDYDEGGVIIIINATTVGFRGTDAAGNVSEVTNVVVDNIDKEPPMAPTAAADITELTNRDVTVTAQFSEDSVKKEYTLDGGETWQDYDEGGVIIIINATTVGFRGTDAAGNVSEVTTLTVDNIDKEPPMAPTAAADITELTNRDVTVTATFSEDSEKKEYTLDGGETWQDYDEGGVIIIINGATVGFRGTDAAGNVSEVTNVVVDNIDKVAPVITLEGDNETTLPSATLTATVDDGSEILYSVDNENWMTYEGEITVTDNGTFFFMATDAAGNTGTNSIVFENIEKTPPDTVRPTVSDIAADIIDPTNQAVTVTAVFADDVAVASALYKLGENGEWLDYPDGGVSVEDNGTVYFKAVDAAGNESEVVGYEVTNIDKVAPIITLTADNRTQLRSDTLTAEADDGSEIFYSTDNENWTKYEGEITVTDNGTFFFKAVDAAGNVGTNSIVFENIDNVPPANPVAAANIVETTIQNVIVSASYSDDSYLRQYSLNGGETWIAYTGPIEFEKNGSVSFRAADRVGNFSEVVTYTVENIVRNGPDGHGNDKLIGEDGKPNPAIVDSEGTSVEEGTGAILLDDSVTFEEDGVIYRNYIGQGDESDISKIVLEKAACLTFELGANGAVKFTVSQITETAKGQTLTYKLKSLQTTSLKPGKNQKAAETTTKKLWLEAGTYYVSMANAKKDGEAFYNVEVNETGDAASKFFEDGDNGDNNWLYDSKLKVWNTKVTESEALIIDGTFLDKETSAVQIDTDPETVIEHKVGSTTYTNFVGFGDPMDIRKIELASAAKLSFDVSLTGGTGKFIVYYEDAKGKMATVKELSTTFKASGTTKKAAVLNAGTYYIAMQSADAKKGDEVYYNVSVNSGSVFYTDGDSNTNDYDSKAKTVSAEVRAKIVELETGKPLQLDGVLEADAGLEIDHDGKTNFVGTGDVSDVVRVNAAAGDSLSLKVTATDAVSLVIYGLQKNGKLKALKTVKAKTAGSVQLDYTLKAKDGSEFFVGVEATNAKKGEAAWYNVDVLSFSGSQTDTLVTPARYDGPDAIAADSLSFGSYDTDVLADASAATLAELDDKSAWQNMLA